MTDILFLYLTGGFIIALLSSVKIFRLVEDSRPKGVSHDWGIVVYALVVFLVIVAWPVVYIAPRDKA